MIVKSQQIVIELEARPGSIQKYVPNARFGEGTISEKEQTAIVNHIKNRPFKAKETLQSTSSRGLEMCHSTNSDLKDSHGGKNQSSSDSPKSQSKNAGHNESSTLIETAASVSDSENSDAEDVIEITGAEDEPVQVPVDFEEPKNQVWSLAESIWFLTKKPVWEGK